MSRLRKVAAAILLLLIIKYSALLLIRIFLHRIHDNKQVCPKFVFTGSVSKKTYYNYNAIIN